MNALTHRPGRRAFTLVELLVVMGIVAIIMAGSVVGLSVLNKQGSMTKSVAEISGLMDYARQHAITNNTYVWVAFKSDDEDCHVAVIESTTGSDVLEWKTSAITIMGNQELRILGPVEKLSGVLLQDAGSVTIDGIDSSSAHSASTVDLVLGGSGGDISFDRAVQFAPTGEARIANSGSNIEIAMTPVQSSTEEPNVALVRLTRATGQVNVLRPEF